MDRYLYVDLHDAWASNNLEKVKQIYNKDKKKTFILCCKYGNIEIAKWLFSFGEINFSGEINHALSYSYGNDSIEIAEWLYSLCRFDVICINKTFSYSCFCGRLKVAKWLFSLDADNIVIDDDIFLNSCTNGCIEVAKWLYSVGNINVHADNDSAFRLSSSHGHLEVAEWLYTIGSNIHANNDYALAFSCFNDQLKIAKWLYSLDNFDIYNINKIFIWICCSGQLDMAKWLYSLNKINTDINHVFIWSCCSGELEVVKWLYSLNKINVSKYNHDTFWEGLYQSNLEIIKWFYLLDEFDNDEIGKCLYLLNRIDIFPLESKTFNLDQFKVDLSDDQMDTCEWLETVGAKNKNTDKREALIGIALMIHHFFGGQRMIITCKGINYEHDDSCIHFNICYTKRKEVRKFIFDLGYIAENKDMLAQYKNYKRDLVTNLNSIIDDEYIIADLWTIVYDYL